MLNARGVPQKMMKFTKVFFAFIPVSVVYNSGFTRKLLYRLFYLSAFCYLFGFIRRPMVVRSFLDKDEATKSAQQQSVNQTLSELDIQLSTFPQSYFVIISGHCSTHKEEQLSAKQKIAFELNQQINKRLQVNANYFGDVKFLFIGSRDIYDLLQNNKTVVEFYEKEEKMADQSMIYIFAREQEGEENIISSIAYKSDLTSVLRIISKHKARKFASSIQF